jgi:hypothetical protein
VQTQIQRRTSEDVKICREFGVNEKWLTQGPGPIYKGWNILKLGVSLSASPFLSEAFRLLGVDAAVGESSA